MLQVGPQSTIPFINLPRPELTTNLLNDDAYALSRLSDVSQVRAWTKRKAAEYHSHMSTLRTIYSSIAPVTTLPVEIMQEIFALVPCREEWCDALWLLSLGLVCRRWHSVLLAASEYWARGIHAVMDPEFYTHCQGYSFSKRSGDLNGDGITRGRALFLARSAPWPLEVPLAYTVDGPGWKVFEGHFERVALFEIFAEDEHELYDILNTVTSRMKRLEKLRVEASSESRLLPSYKWEAKDLPHLRRLEVTSALFCSWTTVPSLRTVVLRDPPRNMQSLPQLFDALKRCPALATLRLELQSSKDSPLQDFTGVLGLPHLRNLAVGGDVSDTHLFLSALSFPSMTFVELDLDNDSEQHHGLALPNVLPRRLSMASAHQMLHGIDRLCFYSNHPGSSRARWGDWGATVSMHGYVQGAQRLRVTPAFRFHSASQFLQILALFSECTVAELALDLRYIPGDVDGEFWTKFFAALPDLCRLELLSPTAESSETKRVIAAHYLASVRKQPRRPALSQGDLVHGQPGRIAPPSQRTASLAWVLHTDECSKLQLCSEIMDVEEVLSNHACSGPRAERLELYVTAFQPPPRRYYYQAQPQALDVTQVDTDEEASFLVKRDYVARLENVADVVVVPGGGWEFSDSEDEESEDSGGDGSDEDLSLDDEDDDERSEGEDDSGLED